MELHIPILHICFILLVLLCSPSFTQDLSDLPTCAQAPALSSIGTTGCQLTDFACICKDQDFINTLTPIIEKNCPPSDLQKVQAFTAQLCGSVGVQVASASPMQSTTSAVGETSTSVPSGARPNPPSGTASTTSTGPGQAATSMTPISEATANHLATTIFMSLGPAIMATVWWLTF